MIHQIKAGGGVVFRLPDRSSEPEVLLIYRNGYWDLPKGKLEEGETLEMCAAREVSEETGTSLPMIIRQLEDSYHEYEEGGRKYGKTTAWYVMCFGREQEMTPQRREGIKAIEWVTLSSATDKVGFENLRKVLQDFSAWWDLS